MAAVAKVAAEAKQEVLARDPAARLVHDPTTVLPKATGKEPRHRALVQDVMNLAFLQYPRGQANRREDRAHVLRRIAHYQGLVEDVRGHNRAHNAERLQQYRDRLARLDRANRAMPAPQFAPAAAAAPRAIPAAAGAPRVIPAAAGAPPAAAAAPARNVAAVAGAARPAPGAAAAAPRPPPPAHEMMPYLGPGYPYDARMMYGGHFFNNWPPAPVVLPPPAAVPVQPRVQINNFQLPYFDNLLPNNPNHHHQ